MTTSGWKTSYCRKYVAPLPPIFLIQVKTNIRKTGRKLVLDPNWSTLEASTNGFHNFLYTSEIEFILIKTDCEVEFQRITPIDTDATSACSTRWDNRSSEQYYIFKVDPAQKVIVIGSPSVRFFRCANEKEQVPACQDSQIKTKDTRTSETVKGAWEAEDVYQKRDAVTGESCPPEDLAEAARRFKAWRAMATNKLFVYLMVPKRMSEAEWIQLLGNGFQFFDDVPWIV